MDGEKGVPGAFGGSMFMFLLPNADLVSVKEKPVRYREGSSVGFFNIPGWWGCR